MWSLCRLRFSGRRTQSMCLCQVLPTTYRADFWTFFSYNVCESSFGTPSTWNVRGGNDDIHLPIHVSSKLEECHWESSCEKWRKPNQSAGLRGADRKTHALHLWSQHFFYALLHKRAKWETEQKPILVKVNEKRRCKDTPALCMKHWWARLNSGKRSSCPL